MEPIFHTLQDWMQALFGTYTPVFYETADAVSVIPSGLAGVDFPYVLSVLLFALIVYSLFRLLGGIFR